MLNASNMKDSTKGKKPTKAPKTQRLNSCVRKLGGSDIDWFNPYGDQMTHFVRCTKSFNAPNFSYNRKKK
jgi:hypothetical protein